MRNELKIVHDATDMLMKDGFEMEEKLRKLSESNEYLTKKLKSTEYEFSQHKCKSKD